MSQSRWWSYPVDVVHVAPTWGSEVRQAVEESKPYEPGIERPAGCSALLKFRYERRNGCLVQLNFVVKDGLDASYS